MNKPVSIFIVEATSGDYEDRSTWAVEAHTTRTSAKRRCAELNQIVRRYSDELVDYRCGEPPIDEEHYDEKKYDAWRKKGERMLRAARRKAHDPMLDHEASYYVVRVELHGVTGRTA